MPPSPIDSLPGRYAVAVHDAGAANIIAAWVAAARSPPHLVVAQGPAKAIWQQRFGEDAPLHDDPQVLEHAVGLECLVSGTGWASELEHRARCIAARRGLRSIAVIDRWVNYAMRFERGGAVQWPSAIWVGDEDALRIAEGVFPRLPITHHDDLYLREQAAQAGAAPVAGPRRRRDA